MAQGIAFCGLNGAGKSTLAHALAKRTGRFEIDTEDFYFPEQKDSRKLALEGAEKIKTCHLGDIPFSVSRTKDEAQAAILRQMEAHPQFVLAGVTLNWCSEIVRRIGIVFLVQTPPQERVRRIQQREVFRFGERVLPGGDMYAQQCEFRKTALERDPAAAEQSLQALKCPVVRVDGTLPVEQNLEMILKRLSCLSEK